jgi:isopenicillin N synthase-like dioxygenase
MERGTRVGSCEQSVIPVWAGHIVRDRRVDRHVMITATRVVSTTLGRILTHLQFASMRSKVVRDAPRGFANARAVILGGTNHVIPVIDISDAFEGRNLDLIAADVTEACSSIGFFQITGFPIATKMFSDAHEAYREFFARDKQYKSQYVLPGSQYQGYKSYGGSLREGFQVGSIETAADARALGIDDAFSSLMHDIKWPDIAGFRSTVKALFSAELEVANLMMSLFARGMGLAPEHFASSYIPDGSNFGAQYYRGRASGDVEASEDALALREHSDTGGITILHQRGDYEGLQIRLVTGDLVSVPVRSDALVVNVGDLLTRWTNGRLRSTPHCVSMPAFGQSRQSIALFHQPAINAEIKPTPELVGAGVALFEPATLNDLLASRRVYEDSLNGATAS